MSVDALVAARYPARLILNLSLDFAKVIPLATRNVIEFCPFILSSHTRWGVWDVYLVVFGFVVPAARNVDELQDEWSSRNNAASSR